MFFFRLTGDLIATVIQYSECYSFAYMCVIFMVVVDSYLNSRFFTRFCLAVITLWRSPHKQWLPNTNI
ncbi:hypothetical protein BC826DRAFT_1085646 [Russula brevipes]|nr:hypothetical protein BC826DRAFT_1085646 [Russula brevipes]